MYVYIYNAAPPEKSRAFPFGEFLTHFSLSLHRVLISIGCQSFPDLLSRGYRERSPRISTAYICGLLRICYPILVIHHHSGQSARISRSSEFRSTRDVVCNFFPNFSKCARNYGIISRSPSLGREDREIAIEKISLRER